MIVYQEDAVTFVKCKVLTAVKIKITVIWNVADDRNPHSHYWGTSNLTVSTDFINL
jgi:hypothetical protein